MLLDGLITSKTRIKLLLKFFINPETSSYLRELAQEFDESTNAIRLELNSLTDAKLLKRAKDKNTVAYKANVKHPLFSDIRNIILKTIGVDTLINSILDKIGNPRLILLSGDYVKGIDSGIIDIVIVGDIDKVKLDRYILQAEKMIGRKVRYLVLSDDDFENLESTLKKEGLLVLWEKINN